MENSTALIMFFVSIAVGSIFLIIGTVLLFRKAGELQWNDSAVVTARVIRLIERRADWVAIIQYDVKGKTYYYSFSVLSEKRFPVGTLLKFYYDPSDPRRAQTGYQATDSKSGKVFGITMVGIGLIAIVVGTIVSYALVTPMETAQPKQTSITNSIKGLFGMK
jgi:hypothetical protein